MTEKMHAIICDLDGTICDTRHRQHFMLGPKKDWASFYAGIPNDPINEWCSDLLYRYADAGYQILFVTGRPEKYRDVTNHWVTDKMPWVLGMGRLFMRTDGDYRADHMIKQEIYGQKILPVYKVRFVLDDRQQVVDMWRRNNLVCLQCAPGDF